MKFRMPFIILIAILLSFSACKEKGTPLIVWRNITNQMINAKGAYTEILAYPDSVLFSGIYVAKLWTRLYKIPDTIIIKAAGIIYSDINPEPNIKTDSVALAFPESPDSAQTLLITDTAWEFNTIIDGLSLETKYYARSFIIYITQSGNEDTAFNQHVITFSTARPQDIWFSKSDFSADPRTDAVAFVINNNPYIGTGKNGLNLLKDFWKYDPQNDSWTSVNSLSGAPRYKAVAFVIRDTVYVGLGLLDINDETSFTGDFYKSYAFNFWEQIDYIDSTAERYDAIGFSAIYNNHLMGFVALGRSYGIRSDIYMYDPGADVDSTLYGAWANVGNFPTESYGAAVVEYPTKEFVLVAAGKNDRGYVNKFYKYNPTTGECRVFTIDTFPGPPRYDAVAAFVRFTRDNTTHEMFYFGTGRNDTAYFNDWYAYDLTQDKWYVKSYIHQDFKVGAPRSGAVCFSANKAVVQYGLRQRIFVCCGYDGERYLKDVWEYLP